MIHNLIFESIDRKRLHRQYLLLLKLHKKEKDDKNRELLGGLVDLIESIERQLDAPKLSKE